MKNIPENILIIGAGLCGSLLALRLAQRGYQIELLEKRPDLRKTDIAAGRSINLAYSDRGIKAMKLVGLAHKVDKLCIPMQGRVIHDEKGDTLFSAYSGLENEYINSISRTDLNALLLDEAEKMPNLSLSFNQECVSINLKDSSALFKEQSSLKKIKKKATCILGADGAGSTVRESMKNIPGFKFHSIQEFLEHGYKELHIPPGKKNSFQIEKNALHIWPRGAHMLIALPNFDGSFTVTLFLSYKEGNPNFEELHSPEAVNRYFRRYYPDALHLMPNLTKEFFKNPTSPLGTVKCNPWHYQNKTLLLGDAAHAIVPFYGQGMNASFEDIVVLDEILEKHPGNWNKVFEAYQGARKNDTDAIADLAIDNFHEMKEDTASSVFQQKRKLETAFEQKFPKRYASKYRLVTFQEDIGYDQAMRQGRAQDEAILRLISEKKIPDSLSLEEKLGMVIKETQQLLEHEKKEKAPYGEG